MKVRKATEPVRTPLSRARVLGAAVALADAEGLAAVTMRRLAADLGVEAMSLYHHVPGKDALLEGLVETVLEEIQAELAAHRTDGAFPDWRADVRERCLAARVVMVRHAWAPALIGSRRSIPAGAYAHYEAIVAAMVGGGLSYHLAHRGLHALGSMALGFAQEVFSPAPEDAELDREAAQAEFAAFAQRVPHLSAMAAAEIHANDENVLGWCDSQAEFEFTLDLLLDGLARAAAADSP
jgi:AcrR family transcriptional regulator